MTTSAQGLKSIMAGRSKMGPWLCLLLTFITPVTAKVEAGLIERLLVAAQQKPWLWGVYVFTVGLPMILFISLMWPDKRFGPPDQNYYYKKSDDDDLPTPDEKDPLLKQHWRADGEEVEVRRREPRGLQRKSDLELKGR